MRRHITTLAALLLVAALIPATNAAASADRDQAATVAAFDTMAPVSEPFTGSANAVRGVPGGGLPWELDEAKGRLTDSGEVRVKVEGLVLARRAPVPEAQQGTNPIPAFKVVVSCLTTRDGEAATVNAETATAPATATGDAKISGTVDLPSPCFAPVIFVTSPTGAWFAATGS